MRTVAIRFGAETLNVPIKTVSVKSRTTLIKETEADIAKLVALQAHVSGKKVNDKLEIDGVPASECKDFDFSGFQLVSSIKSIADTSALTPEQLELWNSPRFSDFWTEQDLEVLKQAVESFRLAL